MNRAVLGKLLRRSEIEFKTERPEWCRDQSQNTNRIMILFGEAGPGIRFFRPPHLPLPSAGIGNVREWCKHTPRRGDDFISSTCEIVSHCCRTPLLVQGISQQIRDHWRSHWSSDQRLYLNWLDFWYSYGLQHEFIRSRLSATSVSCGHCQSCGYPKVRRAILAWN